MLLGICFAAQTYLVASRQKMNGWTVRVGPYAGLVGLLLSCGVAYRAHHLVPLLVVATAGFIVGAELPALLRAIKKRADKRHHDDRTIHDLD